MPMPSQFGEIIKGFVLLAIAIVVVVGVNKAKQFSCVAVPENYTQMKPTIEPGKRIMYTRVPPRFSSAPVGSVIVYRIDAKEGERTQVGRVVAQQGEMVTIRNGKYAVDGSILNTRANASQIDTVYNLIVPRDCVLVGFDAPNKSPLKDCIVPLSRLIGKVKK